MKNLIPKLAQNPKILKRFINLWFPFLGAGIKVTSISDDFRNLSVELKDSFLTRNIAGFQYGASMASMADPFYMTMLIHNLGRDYVVLDKGYEIDFKKPGTTKLTTSFNLTNERIEEIKAIANEEDKHIAEFRVEIKDTFGDIVSVIDKKIYISTKEKHDARLEARKKRAPQHSS